MVSIDFLKTTEVFKGLNDAQLAEVQKCCQLKDYHRGVKLFGEGDDAACLWIVMDGQVDIRFDLPDRPTSEENNISSVTKGMAFGWSSLVPPGKYKLSGYCESRICRLVQVDKKSLMGLFEKDAAAGYRVMSNLAGIIGKRFHQLQDAAATSGVAATKITVHMATCGIAAGARDVMFALMEEIAQANRHDIKVETGGCIGRCKTEPNVTVKIGGAVPVIYQHVNAQKIRQIFKKHILEGHIQQDFVLAT